MMNEWNGMIDGWGSDLKDLTIFISFHLRWKFKSKMQRHLRDVAHSDRTRAAVVEVLARWTSLTAIFWPSGLTTPSSVIAGLGLHNQTLPQFPKPIYQKECRIVPSTLNGIEPTSSINSRRSDRIWSEREKISEDSAGRVGNCGGM